MISHATFFSTEQELSAMTGLNHEELWAADFNLDDWDWGFCTPEDWEDEDSDCAPYYMTFLLNRMDSYCCGYRKVKYKTFYYYMVYHS